ncbi:MAG: FGGY family carbohydrate kinase, partial [Terracidiphilus sp.]
MAATHRGQDHLSIGYGCSCLARELSGADQSWYAACAEKTDLREECKAMWFLGMDVGTGGTRAVVVDANGKLISGASSEHAPFRTPHPGWAEQDPEDWWRAAQEAIRSALASAPEPRQPIAGIGLT